MDRELTAAEWAKRWGVHRHTARSWLRNLHSKYLTQDIDESHVNYCVDTPEDLARLEKLLNG